MRRTIATLGALAAGATVALAGAAPAHANDKTIPLRNANGVVIARATWTDRTDTLCVISLVRGRKMTATLTLMYQNWGPVNVSDSGYDSRPSCTGNLSIPEDRLAFVIVGDQNRSTDGTFYT